MKLSLALSALLATEATAFSPFGIFNGRRKLQTRMAADYIDLGEFEPKPTKAPPKPSPLQSPKPQKQVEAATSSSHAFTDREARLVGKNMNLKLPRC